MFFFSLCVLLFFVRHTVFFLCDTHLAAVTAATQNMCVECFFFLLSYTFYCSLLSFLSSISFMFRLFWFVFVFSLNVPSMLRALFRFFFSSSSSSRAPADRTFVLLPFFCYWRRWCRCWYCCCWYYYSWLFYNHVHTLLPSFNLHPI